MLKWEFLLEFPFLFCNFALVKTNKIDYMKINVVNDLFKVALGSVVFRQAIIVKLTHSQLNEFNASVMNKILDNDSDNNTKLFLKNISEGINYSNLTTFSYFKDFFDLNNNKKIKKENTIIKVYLVN